MHCRLCHVHVIQMFLGIRFHSFNIAARSLGASLRRVLRADCLLEKMDYSHLSTSALSQTVPGATHDYRAGRTRSPDPNWPALISLASRRLWCLWCRHHRHHLSPGHLDTVRRQRAKTKARRGAALAEAGGKWRTRPTRRDKWRGGKFW